MKKDETQVVVRSYIPAETETGYIEVDSISEEERLKNARRLTAAAFRAAGLEVKDAGTENKTAH